MDPITAILTGAALLGCMMLSYIAGWKDAVAQLGEAKGEVRERSTKD